MRVGWVVWQAEPGSVPTIHGAVVAVNRIPFFKGRVCSKSKFHGGGISHPPLDARVRLLIDTRGVVSISECGPLYGYGGSPLFLPTPT